MKIQIAEHRNGNITLAQSVGGIIYELSKDFNVYFFCSTQPLKFVNKLEFEFV